MAKMWKWCRLSIAAIPLLSGMAAAQEPAKAVTNTYVDPLGFSDANWLSRSTMATLAAKQNGDDQGMATYLNYAITLGAMTNPADELLGATLTPVSDTLRAQLAIPAGRGLLATNLRNDGPSAQAGVKANDILLTLADKPLGSADDLTKQLKAAGEAAVALKVLRSGKPVTLTVQPVYHVTLGAPAAAKKDYFIGVSVDAIDESLRAQLGLTGGVVITEITKGSPAEKAGVQPHDIIVELGGKAISATENLTSQVQANKDKETTLKLLRGGKPMSVQIAGAPRPGQSATVSKTVARYFTPTTANPGYGIRWAAINSGGTDESVKLWDRLAAAEKQIKELRRVEELEKELAALREAVEKMEADRKAAKGKK